MDPNEGASFPNRGAHDRCRLRAGLARIAVRWLETMLTLPNLKLSPSARPFWMFAAPMAMTRTT